jgi:hypothetical protein
VNEREDRTVPGLGRGELLVAQELAGRGIEHGDVVSLRVCICPGDNETVTCHDG